MPLHTTTIQVSTGSYWQRRAWLQPPFNSVFNVFALYCVQKHVSDPKINNNKLMTDAFVWHGMVMKKKNVVAATRLG
jgi:hypothetical protein